MHKEDLKNSRHNSNLMANSAFSDQIPAVYGGVNGGSFDNSQGYLDMLAFQDYGGVSIFDLLQQPLTVDQPPAPPSFTVPETSEVVNTPSSISGSSNEAANDVDQENNTTRSDDDQEKTTNKQLEAKKKNPKKQREPRFAFMTRTELDNLDDGYRWRKYGQKAVKNSPFPRNYYRCTTASCGVKKRVERSSEDRSTVVTTYEGSHTHPCPVTSRGILHETASYGGLNGGVSSFLLPQLHYQQPPQPFSNNQTTSLSFNNTTTMNPSSHYLQERQLCPSSLLTDHGLLQDMVPFQVRKEEQE